MSPPSYASHSAGGALPPLREWQATCLQKALRSLTDQRPHFLCQATPGAGKMLMASVLAHELLRRGDIAYVLYLGPTRGVVERAVQTLSQVTGQPMHGRMGAIGAGLTYHALQHRLEDLKRLCSQAQVLLIWDESHHAAGFGEQPTGANQWGMALLALERHVRFTLALSGTPWRTDGSCLPLLRYLEVSSPDNSMEEDESPASQLRQLQPDYVYTLKEAIRDGVCRYPRLQLVDNRSIEMTRFHPRTGRRETRHYPSIPHLLKHPAIDYRSLVRLDAPLQRVLDRGCEQLNALRQRNPCAAGLVVASDIEHAEEVAQRLEEQGASVCLVTSKAPGAHAHLATFQEESTEWIVSVGMVSEGIDIPRLQVCCYLSHIRTEQYFRQVLGRIIRRVGHDDAECHFFALNEQHLRRYARRLNDDLPDDLATVTLTTPTAAQRGTDNADYSLGEKAGDSSGFGMSESRPAPSSADEEQDGHVHVAMAAGNHESTSHDVAFSQAFFERLVALRLS
ncbi:DEAD/DEAH box helicase family protein [Marinobacter sp. TBZ242]|uniref:DEAD/DEAH box helicase family protein n=1 Tax=Marinobacter azerbaijanicus TaxID=3050455 RepID=A0ABT7IIB1_9GAMM|nr:DEAD/DEAH box helicase family protein [Marinobacter sp. TBZ242]MDL0433900.1 DEAD/DEAH box helicase family protein [Marinobacter sp. TBZ242]